MERIEKLDQAFVDTQLICPDGKKKVEVKDPMGTGIYIEVRSTSPGEGTYYFNYHRAGRRKHQKIGRTTDISLAEARKQAKALKASITLGTDPRGERDAAKAVPTMAEFWRDSYEPLIRARLRSVDKLESLWRLHLKDRYSCVRLDQLKRHELETYHASLTSKDSKNLSEAQADHVLKLVRAMLNRAVEWEVISVNPVAKIKLYNPDNKIGHFLTPSELQRLMVVLQTDSNRTVCLLVIFLLATSARLNEALSARFSDIDVERRSWRIGVASSKSRKARTVPLSDLALESIELLRAGQLMNGKMHSHLFVSPKTGKKLSYVHKVWGRLRAQAKLGSVRLHDMRHTGASLILAGSGNLLLTSRVLGHASITLTASTYSHVSQHSLITAVQSSSDELKKAMQATGSKGASDGLAVLPVAAIDAATEELA